MTISDIWAIIDRHTHPLDGEVIPLISTFGRVSVRSLSTDKEMPPFDVSALDGYALNGEGPSFVIEEVLEPFSRIRRRPKAGGAFFVPTGGRLPPASRFVAREHVREEGRTIVVKTKMDETRVVKKGDWLKQGTLLIDGGESITPSAMALLALAGIETVTVHRRPTVAVITTGGELKQGRLIDSNRFLLTGLIHRDGGDLRGCHTADDTEEDILHILSVMGPVDLLILTGGTSKGRMDVTKPAMKRWGGTFCLESPPVLPGKTMAFGRKGDTVFYILPGNPGAVRNVYELFVKRSLFRLAGRSSRQEECALPLIEAIEKPQGFVTATPVLIKTETSTIQEMRPREPNGFVVLEEDTRSLQPGQRVRVILT
jgi:molybdopterin molybdotransferase